MITRCNWCMKWFFANRFSVAMMNCNGLCYHCSRGGTWKINLKEDKLERIRWGRKWKNK